MNRIAIIPNTSSVFRAWTSLAPLFFVALTVVFGLQMLRMLIIGLAVYLRQVKDIPSVLIGVIGFAVFLTAFFAPVILRILGRRNALLVTAGGLGLTRLVEQFVSSVPMDLTLSMVGTILFLWFIPILLHSLPGEEWEGAGSTAIGILLGFAMDTAIKGVFDTADLSWVEGAAPDVVVAVLAVAQLLLLWRLIGQGPKQQIGPNIIRSLPLLALGPLLALEFLLFQNIAQQTVLTGWPQPAVYTWILVANLAGIVAASALMRWHRQLPWPIAALLGGLLVLMVIDEQSGILAAFIVLVGQTAVALALVSIAISARGPAGQPSIVGLAAWSGACMLLLLALVLVYYASYDIDLAIPRQALLPIGAGVVALAVIRSGLASDRRPRGAPFQWAPILPALLLLILPLVHFLAWDEPEATEGNGFPVRVMSYNLHQGFDVEGRLGMEALAQVIEGQNPDIVALQEVSRGWVINDSVDTLVWLSQRLDLPYVWGPATDSVWGNAVLSRFPVGNVKNHSMPNNGDILIDRGFISLEVDVGDGEALTVIATHLHAGADEGHHRVPQVEAIVDFWGQAGSTLLLGDLNARPDDPEMVLLAQAGLKDTFIASGAVGSGYTSESDNPHQRIDYIWMSPDLRARGFAIPQSLASDHLGVAVTVYR